MLAGLSTFRQFFFDEHGGSRFVCAADPCYTEDHGFNSQVARFVSCSSSAARSAHYGPWRWPFQLCVLPGSLGGALPRLDRLPGGF